MSIRRLQVHPNLDQLKHQAKDLFAKFRAGDPAVIAEFREHHPDKIHAASAKLAVAKRLVRLGEKRALLTSGVSFDTP